MWKYFRDQSDHLPYKAYYITDINYEKFYDSIANDISNYILSITQNQKDSWINKYFGEEYPIDLENDLVISDIISRYTMKYESNVYQCPQCNNIFFEDKETTRMYRFEAIEDNCSELFNK